MKDNFNHRRWFKNQYLGESTESDLNEGDLDDAIEKGIEKEMNANEGRFETPFPTRELNQILNTKDHNDLSPYAKIVLKKLKKKYKPEKASVPDQIKRFEDTADMRDLKLLHDMLRIVSTRWFENEFDKEDIKKYINHYIDQI